MAKTQTRPSTQNEVDEKRSAAADKTVLDTVQVNNGQIANWFTYHQPDAEQIEQIKRIRAACGACAQVIKDNTPNSADQTAAIRKVREAMMTANAAIACRGR